MNLSAGARFDLALITGALSAIAGLIWVATGRAAADCTVSSQLLYGSTCHPALAWFHSVAGPVTLPLLGIAVVLGITSR